MRFHDREVGIIRAASDSQLYSDTLLKTIDGGFSWHQLYLPLEAPYRLFDFYMLKDEVWLTCLGQLGGTPVRILHSSNIGESWEVIPFDSSKHPYEIQFSTPQIGRLLVRTDSGYYSLYHTSNSGLSWEIGLNALVYNLASGYFPYTVVCRRVLSLGEETIRSSDYGATFTELGNIPTDFCYAGDQVWMAPGYRSTDDGNSWFTSKDAGGWADTTGDVYSFILNPDSLFVSHDRGLTRAEHPFYRGTWPGQVEIVDSLYAYATDGTFIYKTTSGGVGDLAGVSPKASNSPILQHFSNFPNPFTSKTMLSFSNPKRQHADLRIIDILGKECGQIFSGNLDAGDHNFEWNASHVPDGVYFCVVRSESGVAEMPLVVRH